MKTIVIITRANELEYDSEHVFVTTPYKELPDGELRTFVIEKYSPKIATLIKTHKKQFLKWLEDKKETFTVTPKIYDSFLTDLKNNENVDYSDFLRNLNNRYKELKDNLIETFEKEFMNSIFLKYKEVEIFSNDQLFHLIVLPCYAGTVKENCSNKELKLERYKPKDEKKDLLRSIISQFDLNDKKVDLYIHDLELGLVDYDIKEKFDDKDINTTFSNIRVFNHTTFSKYKKILNECAFVKAEIIDEVINVCKSPYSILKELNSKSEYPKESLTLTDLSEFINERLNKLKTT